MTRAMRLSLLLLLTLLLAAGCSGDDYSDLKLLDVSGTVTLDGRPLAGAKVAFIGDDQGGSVGVTDSSGRYKLMYDSQRSGVTPGSKIVRITQADADAEGADPGAPESGEGAVKEPIPPRYNRESILKADIAPGKTTFDFELKSSP
jgi:hypothetical protein